MGHRVLIVGAGARARQWLHEVRTTEGWDATGMVDPDQRALADALRDASDARVAAHTTLEAGLAAGDADAAIIASPAETHVEAADAAMSAGLSVLIEKPMAPTLEEARRLVRVAEERRVAAIAGQNYRYMRAHRTVNALMRADRLGTVHLVRAGYFRVPHDIAPSLASSGHSILWGAAVHHLDVFRYVLQQEAVEVTARMSTLRPDENPAGATLSALITMDRGTEIAYLATYESTGHEYFEGGQEYYQRLTGDKATLHMIHRWLVLAPKGGLPRIVRRGRRERTEESILLDQLDAAMRGEDVPCSARDNLGTVAMLEACVRSSRERRTVSVPELLGRLS